MRVPETWKTGSNLGKLEVLADGPGGRQFLSMSQVAAVDQPVSALARDVVRHFHWSGKPTVQPTVTVGGEPAYHVSGPFGGRDTEDQIGLIHDGVSYTLHFDRDFDTMDDEEWQQLIDSVLASAEWTG